MSTVDSKVVEMKFDNKGFSEGVKNTIQGLSNLTSALAKAASSTSLDGLGKAADHVSNRFSLMRVAAVTAVATIASQATRAAENLVKSFTLDPIMEGFHNYETQINAVQTILANTGLEGAKGLKQVNDVLADLNTYANQTVYNFSDMTKNIGTFTAAGVALKPAADAIKGIANLAALSGSSSDQASTAMYQLSQAIAANKVGLQDWNSVVNAGLGGKVFQRALFNTGATMKTIKGLKVGETFDQWTKAGNSFRGSLQKGWITGDVLTKTLAQFTGDMTDAQLAAQGFSKSEIVAIQKLAKTAEGAATNIKTVSQLKDALKEEVGTAYATIFKTLLGDINGATKLLSGLHVALENALTGPIYKVNAVLEKWAKLGGRVRFIDAIKYAFKDLMSVITPINHAFRDIFPAETPKKLYDLTNKIEKFFQYFKLGAKSGQNLKETFKGVFAVFDIGIQVLKQVAHFIGDVFSAITRGSSKGGFLAITAHLAGFVIALDQAVKHGHGLTDFFKGLEKMLAGPIKLLHQAEAAVASFLAGGHTPTANDIRAKLAPLEDLGHKIVTAWLAIPALFHKVIAAINPFGKSVGDGVSNAGGKFVEFKNKVEDFFKTIDFNKIGSAIAKIAGAIGAVLVKVIGATFKGLGSLFKNVDFSQLLSTINTGLFAGIFVLLKKFLSNAGGTLKGAGGIIDAIKEPFEGLTGVLTEMQKTLKATILLEIAIAIGILAAACTALAKINPQALTNALQAIGTLMAELFATLFGFTRIGGVTGIVATATAMVVFAGAIAILTGVLKSLAKMKLEDLNKGLGALAKLIAEVVLASIALGKYAAPMISGSAAMVIMAGAIKILAGVVKDLGALDVQTLAKGLKSVGALLAGLALFSKFAEADKLGVLSGAGLILLAEGIKRLSGAVIIFGQLDVKTLRQGLITVGAILAGFALFSRGVGNPAAVIGSAASMVIVAFALKQMIKPLQAFGAMSWNEIAKGLVTVAGAIGSIALALSLMPPTTIVSAAAIAVVAQALGLIGDAIIKMSGMSWEDIAKGLVTLAGALVIIGTATTLMAGALPGAAALVVVAGALSLLAPVLVTLGGLSWSQVAIGLVALAGALAVIGVAAALLTPVIPSLLALGASMALIGLGVAGVGAGIFLVAGGLAALAAAGAGAAAVIVAIVGGVIALIPVLATKLVEGIDALVIALTKALPDILKLVKRVLLDLINVLNSVVPPLVNTVIKLLGLILNQLSAHAPKFFEQMAGLIVSMAKAIKDKAPALVKDLLDIVGTILTGLANHAQDFVDAAGNIIINLIKGLTDKTPDIVTAAVNFVVTFLAGLSSQATNLINAALDFVVTFINGLAEAIRTHTQPLIDAGENLADAIISGIVKGLADVGGKVASAAAGLGGKALGGIKNFLGIHSPSTEFIKIGNYVSQGFAIGISQGTAGVKAAFQQSSDLLKKAVDDSRTDILNYQDSIHKYTDAYKKSGDQVAYYTQKIKEAAANHKTTQSSMQKLEQELANAQKAHRDAGNEIDKYKQLLEQATKDHLIAKDALANLTNGYKKQHTELLTLGKAYDGYMKQLDTEKQKLEDLKTTRDDYISSIKDQYDVLPDVSQDTTAASYTTNLTESLADLTKFATVLQQLRSLGLDDQTYQLLLSKGTSALPLMEELLQNTQSGGDNLNYINEIDKQLGNLTTGLSQQAGQNLYQAGIDAQSKIVAGLTADAAGIQAQMNTIATQIVAGLQAAMNTQGPAISGIGAQIGGGLLGALKGVLGIHSPSKEMEIVGGFAIAGLVNGLKNSTSDVSDAAGNLGTVATESLRKSLSNMVDQATDITNLSPTITPILDLSDVRKNASTLGDILTPAAVDVSGSLQKAKYASAEYQSNKDASYAATNVSASSSPAAPIAFTQNNYSPKALSAAEIYRNTRNQLSIAKGGVTQNVAP